MSPALSDRAPVAEPMRDPSKRWMFIVALLVGSCGGGCRGDAWV